MTTQHQQCAQLHARIEQVRHTLHTLEEQLKAIDQEIDSSLLDQPLSSKPRLAPMRKSTKALHSEGTPLAIAAG